MRDSVQRLRDAAGLWLLVLCCSLLCPALLAQYRFTQWTADSGLPQSSVRGIVQTPDGYLWVATLNGLARFDGVRFQIFDKSNTPQITSNRITAMVPGEGSDTWFTSEDHNVVRMHNGMFTTLNEQYGLRPGSVMAITGDRGQVWIQSNDKVLLWNEHAHRFERAAFSTDDLHFEALRWAGTGFWAIKGQQLICFDRGRLLTFAMPSHVSDSDISGVVVNANGEGWLGTRDGWLGRLGDTPATLDTKDAIFTLPLAGAQWKLEISPQRFERRLHLPIGGLDHPVLMNAIQSDNEGNVWLGTEGDGLYRIQRQQIKVLTTDQGLASNNTYPVLATRDGAIWAGSWPNGLSEIRNGKVVRTIGKADGLEYLVSSLAEDRDGVLWVGTQGGLGKLVQGHIVAPVISPTPTGIAQAILPSPDGTLFVGTTDGLWIVQGTKARRLRTNDGLATNDVRTIITDHQGAQWIGGYGGLTRLHNGQLTRWTEKEGLPSNNVRSIHEDAAGAIWVGTYDGGIGWLRNGTWTTFNKQRGLYDNGAFQILEDAQKRFWISSNRGIYRVDREQLAAVADGRESLVTNIVYGRADGMLSSECNGGLWPSGARDAQGLFYFPTQMGLAIINPEKMQVVEQAPNVVIENLSVNHQLQNAVGTVTLRPSQTDLEINYIALSHTKPEQITFSYKLDGVDADWQSVGLRRTAYYTHLPPGDYIFRVKARNSDGIESQKHAEVHVVVVPPFYRQWWFLMAAFILFGTILSAVWQYRVSQLKQTQQRQQNFSRQLIASQEGERRRIAAELHDSLGQRLIIINNLAIFLLKSKGKVRSEEDKRQTVEEISEEATAAIEETRAISYALRPFQLDRLGLTRAIQALCTSVQRGSEIIVTANLDDIDNVFSEDLRINVYRIVQEALNNVVKHSQASHAFVTATCKRDSVTLTIRDNGRGMPMKPTTPEPGQGGFGVTGMRERITLLHGTLEIESGEGAGTRLSIRFAVA